MKRFYYQVGRFTPESESKLATDQYTNDGEFIGAVFHEYKLHPFYSKKERDENGMDYTGHLDFQLYNWEGNKSEWLDHTIFLFNRELKSIKEFKNQDIDGKKVPGKKLNNKDLHELNYAIKWLNKKREEYKIEQEMISESLNSQELDRIKWLGKPSQFGYLFLELIKRGYIELPMSKGVYSNARLAKICFKNFDFDKDTTEGTLIKELNNKSNSLTDANRKAFIITEISKLS